MYEFHIRHTCRRWHQVKNQPMNGNWREKRNDKSRSEREGIDRSTKSSCALYLIWLTLADASERAYEQALWAHNIEWKNERTEGIGKFHFIAVYLSALVYCRCFLCCLVNTHRCGSPKHISLVVRWEHEWRVCLRLSPYLSPRSLRELKNEWDFSFTFAFISLLSIDSRSLITLPHIIGR